MCNPSPKSQLSIVCEGFQLRKKMVHVTSSIGGIEVVVEPGLEVRYDGAPPEVIHPVNEIDYDLDPLG
jgi:hypothetical protein